MTPRVGCGSSVPGCPAAVGAKRGRFSMKRYGMVNRIKPDCAEEYRKYHAAVWPDVLSMIGECNIANYSIYLKDDLLFSYFEYHGSDFRSDMARMVARYGTHAAAAANAPNRGMVGRNGGGFSPGLSL